MFGDSACVALAEVFKMLTSADIRFVLACSTFAVLGANLTVDLSGKLGLLKVAASRTLISALIDLTGEIFM